METTKRNKNRNRKLALRRKNRFVIPHLPIADNLSDYRSKPKKPIKALHDLFMKSLEEYDREPLPPIDLLPKITVVQYIKSLLPDKIYYWIQYCKSNGDEY
jgi:hypothetical protein